MSQTILVTGASGYIGSHTVAALVEAGYDVIALENSNLITLSKVEELTNNNFRRLKCELLNIEEVRNIFKNYQIDVVIHLAATKGINGCTQTPVDFYNNNIASFLNLLKIIKEFNVKKLIFGSSCAVYGYQKSLPVSEDAKLCPLNVYAKTKFFAEEILKDIAKLDANFSCIILRIFNPIGAHSSGILGEDPNKQQINILTLLAKHALGMVENLKISPDCVRDFIHVVDTAEVHIKAVEKLKTLTGLKIYNVGSGVGTSLEKLTEIFQHVTGREINFIPKPCVENELKEIFADIKLIKNELNFEIKKTNEEMIRDCWNFMIKNFSN